MDLDLIEVLIIILSPKKSWILAWPVFVLEVHVLDSTLKNEYTCGQIGNVEYDQRLYGGMIFKVYYN